VAAYEYRDGMPALRTEYATSDGLPSDDCRLLVRDADGGTWAACASGVGYLARGGGRWTGFTSRNGFLPGEVLDLALSADGRRAWVTTDEGLATADTRDRAWHCYMRKGLLRGLYVHPERDTVWCWREGPGLGEGVAAVSEFRLDTGRWHDLPYTGDDPCAPSNPPYFCWAAGFLWVGTGIGPPLLYSPATERVRTWPRQPNWERVINGNLVVYREAFGEIHADARQSDRMWLATSAGLWDYAPGGDRWQAHAWSTAPSVGEPRLAMSADGGTIYWACDGNIAALNLDAERWTHLWNVRNEYQGNNPQSLVLSPDGRYLWWFGFGGILVGEIASRRTTWVTNREAPGLSAAGMVRFDAAHEVALVPTPRGLVCTDYAGHPKAIPSQPASPITQPVGRLAFSPDGSEVWCFMGSPLPLRGEDRGRAAVLYPETGAWEEIPDPHTIRCLHDVVFTKDGRTTWIALSSDDEPAVGVLMRTRGDRQWRPLSWRIPEHATHVARLWLAPKEDELWVSLDGCGLLRLVLTTGELTQYVLSSFREMDGVRHQPLATDYAWDLSFSADGTQALCGATVIDLGTGEARNTRESSQPADSGPAGAWPVPLALLDIPAGGQALPVAEGGDLYTVSSKDGTLTCLRDRSCRQIAAMAISPQGYAWVATRGALTCLDPATGRERRFPRPPPATSAVAGGAPLPPRSSAPNVSTGPVSVDRTRFAPCPSQAPERPLATPLGTQGVAMQTTATCCVAAAPSGRIYVIWYARPGAVVPPTAGMPAIPSSLLFGPDRDEADMTTVPGISVFDGHRWLPPQRLVDGDNHCDPCFAWCSGEDLNLLAGTAVSGELHHFVYCQERREWSRLHVLTESGDWCVGCLRDGIIHLAGRYRGAMGTRVYYRSYQNGQWSAPVWCKAGEERSLPHLAVGADGSAHLVWREGETHRVTHAIIKGNRATQSTEDFGDRPIRGDSLDLGLTPAGEPLLAYLAEVPRGNPDCDTIHLRAWTAGAWSPPVVLESGGDALTYSLRLVNSGGRTLLSWEQGREPGSSWSLFSVLGPDGTWECPQPLCRVEGDAGQSTFAAIPFIRFHVDGAGCLHAAWEREGEVSHVFLGRLP
jgi:hypothetical protein